MQPEVATMDASVGTASDLVAGNPWQALADVAQRSQRYLNALGERSVTPSREALDGLAAFDVQLQDAPISAEALIEELDRIGSPATVAIAGPRYFCIEKPVVTEA